MMFTTQVSVKKLLDESFAVLVVAFSVTVPCLRPVMMPSFVNFASSMTFGVELLTIDQVTPSEAVAGVNTGISA